MPRDDFDVITGPTAPSRPIPPASLPPAPEATLRPSKGSAEPLTPSDSTTKRR